MSAILRKGKKEYASKDSKTQPPEYRPLYPELQVSKFYVSPIFQSFFISTIAMSIMLFFIWMEFASIEENNCSNIDIKLGANRVESVSYCNEWLSWDEVKKILNIPEQSPLDSPIDNTEKNYRLSKSRPSLDESLFSYTSPSSPTNNQKFGKPKKLPNRFYGNSFRAIDTEDPPPPIDIGTIPPPVDTEDPPPPIDIEIIPPPVDTEDQPPPVDTKDPPPSIDTKDFPQLKINIKVYNIDLKLNILNSKTEPSYEATVNYIFQFNMYQGEEFYLNAKEFLQISIDDMEEQHVENFRHDKGVDLLFIKFKNTKYSTKPCDISAIIKIKGKISSVKEGHFYFTEDTSDVNVIGDFSDVTLSSFIPCFDLPKKRSIFKLRIELDIVNKRHHIIQPVVNKTPCNMEQFISSFQFSFAVLSKSVFESKIYRLKKCSITSFYKLKDGQHSGIDFNMKKLIEFYSAAQNLIKFDSPIEEDQNIIVTSWKKSNPSSNWRLSIIDSDTASHDWKSSHFLPAVMLAQLSYSISLFHSFHLKKSSDYWFFRGATSYLGINTIDSSDLFKKMVEYTVLIDDWKYSPSRDEENFRDNLHSALTFNRWHAKIDHLDDFIISLFKSDSKDSSEMLNSISSKMKKNSIDMNQTICSLIFYDRLFISVEVEMSEYLIFRLEKLSKSVPAKMCPSEIPLDVKIKYRTDKTEIQDDYFDVTDKNNFMTRGIKLLAFFAFKRNSKKSFKIVYDSSLQSKFIESTFGKMGKMFKTLNYFLETIRTELLGVEAMENSLDELIKPYIICKTLNYLRNHLTDDKSQFDEFLQQFSIPKPQTRNQNYSSKWLNEECEMLSNIE